MNVPFPSSHASDAAPSQVVLTPDFHITTVALDLVRAAAEYETLAQRNEDTAGLIDQFSKRFKIDAQLSESLLSGRTKVDIEGGRLVISTRPSDDIAPVATSRNACRTPIVPVQGSEERAKRMQSVMVMHAAARGVSALSVSSQANVSEFLCDLRHWCDEHMVDIYKAMDQAYIRYMHDKYRGLAPDGC
jgi:hypothetical protein